MVECVDGSKVAWCRDGWIDRCMDWRLLGWMDGWMGACISGQMGWCMGWGLGGGVDE